MIVQLRRLIDCSTKPYPYLLFSLIIMSSNPYHLFQPHQTRHQKHVKHCVELKLYSKDGDILPTDEAIPDGAVKEVGLGLGAGVVHGEAAGEDEAGAGQGGVGAAGQDGDKDLAPSQQHCRYIRY